MARGMDPGYVSARAFRVMFLRGTRYDAEAAAEQMLKFFEMKHQLFGKSKLVKDITLDDLDENDIACLKSGCIQLAGKDRSGRQIILNLPGLRDDNCTLQNELRMRYYIRMSPLESEETQIMGCVSIMYTVGGMKDRIGGSGYYEHAKCATLIPDHKAALHICTDEIGEHLRHYSVITATSMKLRAKCRFHYGSQTECLYHMSTYGIPPSFLPVDSSNKTQISIQHHLKWVESRFKMERNESPLSSAIAVLTKQLITPTENDVLIIGGNRSNNEGNKRFRALVKDLSKAYKTGSKESRKDLVDRVMHSVDESGGRFLKQHIDDCRDRVWRELPKDQIRKTVAQAFRNSYRRK
mmetsp:Transcript_31696/g.76737  ORF Transcript_31696/g.76737 Transcript_31696/m.76737 type:complete len:352 (-) Transcript_31696:564-1619(-)